MTSGETSSRRNSRRRTLSDDQPGVLLKDLFRQVARCFGRRETRQAATQRVEGLPMELEDYNCWSIAEAAGHRGPHRLQFEHNFRRS